MDKIFELLSKLEFIKDNLYSYNLKDYFTDEEIEAIEILLLATSRIEEDILTNSKRDRRTIKLVATKKNKKDNPPF